MIRHTSGILCTPILQEQATALHLDPMVVQRCTYSAAFTVSMIISKALPRAFPQRSVRQR